MQAGKEESTLTINLKSLLFTSRFNYYFFIVIQKSYFPTNPYFKSFGELSIEPQIAFNNGKTYFSRILCRSGVKFVKEMAPKVSDLRDEYQKDINFVFLNVDNPKWENYLKEYEVNGIPQINLFDEKGNLSTTLIGKHTEEDLLESIKNERRNKIK